MPLVIQPVVPVAAHPVSQGSSWARAVRVAVPLVQGGLALASLHASAAGRERLAQVLVAASIVLGAFVGFAQAVGAEGGAS